MNKRNISFNIMIFIIEIIKDNLINIIINLFKFRFNIIFYKLINKDNYN